MYNNGGRIERYLLTIMNDLQKKQLEILKEIIRVCEKHNLKYYLLGGSVLGAVRHEGFIPWDDDIDICMPRPDFDKLMALKDEFKAPYFLQNTKTDPGFTYAMAKLRDSSTTYVETVFSRTKMNHGIFVDIFPLDGMSRRKNAKKAIGPKPYLLWFMWWFTYMGHFYRKPNWKKPHWTLLGYLASIIFLPFNIFNWTAKLIKAWTKSINYDKATLIGPYLTMYFNRDSFPKSWFGDGVEGTFEGMKVILPAEYDKYLTQIYGDYMKLPPLDKQKGHHWHKGCSTTIGYKDFPQQ